MKKIILLLSGLFLLQLSTYAQDESIFTHYNVTPVLINPSAAGFNETHDLQLNARATWSGFADAPKTIAAQYNGPLGDNFGIGLGISSETAAQMQRLRAHLNYAFRFDVSEKVKLSAGFQMQYQELTLDPAVMDNPFFIPNEETVMNFLSGEGRFDAALAAFSTFNENTTVGLTFTNLVRGHLSPEEQNEPILKHYMFYVAHRFAAPDESFVFEPSVLIRNVRDVPSQVDINLKASFLQEQLTAGLSYRSLGSLGLLLGTRLSDFQLYYTYDLFFQDFQQYNDGSHEVTVLFSFERKEKSNRQRRY